VTQAPDLLQPVIAFRAWRVVEGELVSPYLGQRWDDGTVVASCERARLDGRESAPTAHAAPHRDCGCGIHAYFEPRCAVPDVDFRRVLGIVAVWGRLEVHPEGVRAEFARIQALGASRGWSSWHRADVEAVAARLQVPLLQESALGAAAADYGASLPDSLRR
jgi:hypothetical protein